MRGVAVAAERVCLAYATPNRQREPVFSCGGLGRPRLSVDDQVSLSAALAAGLWGHQVDQSAVDNPSRLHGRAACLVFFIFQRGANLMKHCGHQRMPQGVR